MTDIYIETFGCSLNTSDSEVMAGLLKKAGYNITNDYKKSALIILNSCTVKGPTENNFFKRLAFMEKLEKPIVVAGCIPQTDPEKLAGHSLIGTFQLANIVQVAEETLNGNTVLLLVEEKNDRLNLPRIRKNPVIEIIPICAGCIGNCSYCKVKAARGELSSYDASAIVKQAAAGIGNGAKELWLTAQDTGCYGFDISTNLPSLLKEILKTEGDFKIRIGMMNPDNIKSFLDDLLEIYKNKKMFRFIHIPVQSGNNEILKLMKRGYTVEEFKEIIKKIRKEIPDMTISTDIICGFPTETEDQFKDSIKLVEEIRPDVLNISRFWPRPKTEAANMNLHPGGLTKERSKMLADVFGWISYQNNAKWKNWSGEILIDEIGIKNTWIGRNYAYKPVVVSGKLKLGEKANVKIANVTKYDLRGEIMF